jgi:uncharacterized SAM-binding protein YcdF (DUF218 family)
MKLKYRVFFLSLLALLLLWYFRIEILKGVGNYLDASEEPVAVQRIFVLGGGNYDRGFKAARLWYQGYAPKIICTGSYVSGTIKSLGYSYTEAELSRMRILSLDIDSALVSALSLGTSTMEESELILDYCLLNDWDKIIIVSDIFHTSRIRDVFKRKFMKAGIDAVIVGAPSSRYRESEWWREEAGLIMVNNEYIKHLYYWWYY